MNIRKIVLFGIMLSFSVALQAQEEDKWEVNNPPGDLREVSINTTEGTWMNLDVSPDGQTVVFDMLGDIYSMSINGGKAQVLRQGLAFEVQPRFSPDGSKILFTSDAGGGDNIWIMDANGENARQITEESFRLLNNATWHPDGQYFVARKHFTSQRSAGAGEMWMYHISGGSGIQLTERKNDQQDVNEPCFSPDGKYLYFSEDMYPGGYFQYNKDPNSQIYVIRRYDMEEGDIQNLITGPGGAIRPQMSHDGKWIAFVRRVRDESVLFKYNVETGEQFPIFNKLSKDQQEAWALFGAYTGFDWMPDDKHVVIWGGGKIWKVNMEDGSHSEIPFEVNATHYFNELVHFENPVHEDGFTVKAIRHTVTSPDEKWLVFNAAGHLWKKQLPNGKPERLTKGEALTFEPAFSRDGKKLAYVSWTDESMGAIHVMDWGTGTTKKITSEKGIFRTPSFSPDGKSIVYHKEGGNNHQGYTNCQEPGIYTISVSGGEASLVKPRGEYPVYNADGSRVFYQTGGYLFGSLTKSYHSVKPDGSDDKKHFDGKYAQRFVPSPDGKWIAWSELYKVYMAPMPMTGKPVGITASTKAVPVAQVARDAGISIHWSNDSKKLHWTLGDEYFTEELTDRFSFLEGSLDSLPPMDTSGIKIGLQLETDKPEGLVAFTNARIITMDGNEVIEGGDILVEDNKIKKIGKRGSFRIPDNAKKYDCTGKTIMPGLIDVHGHLGNFRYGISPQQQWEYHANLAYGVTTAHDPSSNSEMIFSQSEMIRAGNMVGPRLYSTGTILYGADGDFKAVINNLDDARSAIRRTKAYGAFSVKSYNQPRRDQRQQVIQAAKELGILVVPEGGSHFLHNMSMISDGHTGVEHNIPVAPLFDDVIQFWSATETHNTPTLIVNYGGVNGEYYFYQTTNVWEEDRLLNFTPRAVVDSRSRHRTMIPMEEYENGHILVSESCNKLQEAGVNINLGAHGQLQGLGAHWEMWMFVQGGMDNHQALKAATINGAEYLGMDQEIGSLKEGKLADLIVINGNPLEEIKDSKKVEYTMINGRLYESETMHEIGNYDKECLPFFFQKEGSGNAYPYYLQTGSHMAPSCSCQQ
ncbi:MAG: amidohydrolase family protein [Bacteroidetes bacterium]|nr:amidohydrolase family protein [Bacteroidota bacterium]